MKLLITSTLLFLVIAPLAQANHDRNYHNNGKHSREAFKAKVIKTTPVYKYLAIQQPQTYCEPVTVRKSQHRSHDKGAVIMGGIVGGIIGHATSDNKHKGLGTVVGAVIGSSVVHNIARHNTQTYTEKQHSCVATYKNTSKVRVLDGYSVTYRLKGKLYQTYMQDKPGDTIRIYY